MPLPVLASEHHGQVTFGGVPVPGAVITATQGDKKMTAITNDVGMYSFNDLADGAWTLDVQMTGFAPVKQDVTVSPTAAADKIELKAMSLDELRAAVKPIKVDPAAVAAVAPVSAPAATAPETTASTANGAKPSAGKPSAKTTQQASAAGPRRPASQ